MIDWLHQFKRYPAVIRKAIAAGFLAVGILVFTALLIAVIFLMIFVGTPLALLGNKLGFNTWLKYDCLWNWILGGDIDETISSRLGKSIYFGHDPVFFNLEQDKLIAVFLHQLDHDHVRQSIIPDKGHVISDEQFMSVMSRKLDDALTALGVPL